MPYIVRRLQRMDLTFFQVHSAVIRGRQRGINVDKWLIPYLSLALPTTVDIRYRHVDTGVITIESRKFGQLQKNVRLHGKMIQGRGYSPFAKGDIMLLKFEGSTVTWDVLKNAGRQRPLYRFLDTAANLTMRRNMGVVTDPAKVNRLEQLLSNYDAPLFFADEVEALDAQPASPVVDRLVRRRMSPAAFANLQAARERNGALGEDFIVKREKDRLTDAGRPDLAARVHHVSAGDVTSPYDVDSFEGTGPTPEAPRHGEVKSTSGNGMEFDMSEAEWQFAEQNRQHHVVYRVTQVTSSNPRCREIRDIVGTVQAGRATKEATAYRISVP